VDVHAFAHRRLVLELAVHAKLERVERECSAVGKLQLAVGELVHRAGAGDRRRHQQPRCRAGDAKLVGRQEAAVVAIEPERMVARQRDVAVGSDTRKALPALRTVVSARLTDALMGIGRRASAHRTWGSSNRGRTNRRTTAGWSPASRPGRRARRRPTCPAG
jgi:hypothetical protein